MKLKSFRTSTALTLTILILVFAAATTLATAQTFVDLYDFKGRDGLEPFALVQATNGDLYGTTFGGGPYNKGTVFKITSGGTFTALYNFCAQASCPDGYAPQSALVQATDGNLYGTTSGGANGYGTVFKITPSGTLTTLYSFCSESGCTDGCVPLATPVQAFDGNLYGTTEGCGANHFGGTVFKITPSGMLTSLYGFCSQPDCADGQSPMGALVQDANGNLYGTTYIGGNNLAGTVFKITPSGKFTNLYGFCSQSFCADGANPYAGLVQATNGNLYGTTYAGGANGYGTVFKITPSGTLTTLYSFDVTDGANPYAGLVQAINGNLYGTTYAGGTNGYGTVFEITPSGTLTTLYSLDVADGTKPQAGLLQATSGSFYGTTSGGGVGWGTVFSLSIGLGPFVKMQPAIGKVGKAIEILGQGFTGTTEVSFNGTPATFKVVSDTYLGALVPSGATSGFVTVTTPSGTLKSNKKFLVRP